MSKDLLCITRSYVQYPVIVYNGKESEKEYMHRHRYISICCSRSHAFKETNSLRRTMQIVECSLSLWQAQGRVSS